MTACDSVSRTACDSHTAEDSVSNPKTPQNPKVQLEMVESVAKIKKTLRVIIAHCENRWYTHVGVGHFGYWVQMGFFAEAGPVQIFVSSHVSPPLNHLYTHIEIIYV